MQTFYDRLKEYKQRNGLSFTDLGKIINKSPDAMRQAVNRESLSELEKEKLEQMFAGGELIEKEKASSEETRLEDIIAKRVLEEVGPFIGEMTDRVMAALLELTMSLDRIRSEQEEISQHQETFNKIQKDLKEVQEKTYALIENKQ